jgi:hypothetical protein
MVGEIGLPWEAAVAGEWEDERHPGDWVKVVRRIEAMIEEERNGLHEGLGREKSVA